ncbi:MAG TPA: PLDc N-terminal domain-containing protein [Pseudolysinimonas sp.]|jgi:hypothetical protein|nr:PLDc N-terminal domain-containing protein [Pseudolysinimonas sp.]
MGTLVRYLPFLIYAAITIYSIVDIALIERDRVKGLPKILWILIVVVIPIVGAVLWFLLGRERLSERGGGRGGVRRGPRAPDDDPEFLRKLSREQEQEERIRQLEERLREIDDDKSAE